MSMKSFDKFCEKMILGEPGSEKAIFDERQNQLRQKYTIEALCVFAGSSFLNTLIMECGLQWSESYVMPMVVLAAISYLYWVIRNEVKGTLFGVNGTNSVASTGGLCMAMAIMYSVMFISDAVEEWDTFIIRNGMLSERFLAIIAFVLYFVGGLYVVIAAYRFNKNNSSKEDEE